MLQGSRIMLRLVVRADLPLLEAWENDLDAQSEFNHFGMQPTHTLEAGFNQSGFLTDDQGMLLIVLPDQTPIGSVSYRQVIYGPNSGSRPYAIGIALLTAYRGQGYGVEAQQLITDYLFATYPIA